ncbi:outer membrane beta-barrel family protein [Pedobacter caeni]|uniref:Outer membrane receptor proteins, mostly Fe transport n=1 Tax=Pedobacter caeni TaxID=288992 RepID=A0A1M5HMQ0_9SPHI|nr:outer membrane beta-barrel family protein [Pedobacter caeni]SHG17233.1 Outer membrane receptor proteins, mostly Fe transport [Pedobacter caeni]
MHTYFKVFTPLLFLSLITISAFSQSTKLSGSILDLKDGKAIEFASVALIHLPDSVKAGLGMTNDKGLFAFENIKAGSYLIKVIAVGYERAESPGFELGQTAFVVPALKLKSLTKTLKEVNIISKTPLIQQQADRTVLDVEQMNTAGDNALDVLKRAPGIKLDKDENIIMKGKTGVNVMIDGKMSYMSGLELSTYLKSLPGAVMSKVEFISNPPSSFDAAGSAGIINIKLKRNKLQGFNGNASIGGGYGEYAKGYGSTNLNYNIGKISTYARLSYGYYNSFNRLTMNRNIGGELFNQLNFWHPITKASNYAVGADYFIDDKHTIGILWKGSSAPYTTNSESNSVNYNVAQQKMGSVNSKNPQDNTSGNNAYNLNYRFKIDTNGRELGIDLDKVGYDNSKTEQYLNSYFDAADNRIGDVINLRNKGFGDVSIYAVKVDYVQPFSKTLKAEAGYKSSWVNTSSDVRFDSLKTAGWINDPKRTNRFNYKENINALYLSFSQSFKQLELKAGLRAEQTLGNGFSSGTEEKINRKYWQLFPTFFASWKVSENHQIQGSYARRINRPSYTSLNPFAFYSDPYTALKGNPLLLPSFSNNFEINYNIKNFRVLSLSYAKSTDEISEVIYQNDQSKESISVEENLGRAQNIYIATGSPFDITKWWNNNTELSVAYDEVKSPLQGGNYNSHKFSWSVNSVQTFNLPKDFQLAYTFYYSSPSVSGLFRSLEAYGMNFSARKTFMNKKATISLKLDDIFDTNKFRANLVYNNVNTYWQNQWESRKINLSLNYKFGNMKVKNARSRKTGTADEEKRVKN